MIATGVLQILRCGILGLLISPCGCFGLRCQPKASEFLQPPDAQLAFNVAMHVTHDERDKQYDNISTVKLAGTTASGQPLDVALDLVFGDSESMRSAEIAWRYGKDYPNEPPGLVLIQGLGESAWTMPRGANQEYFVRLPECYFRLSAGGPGYDGTPAMHSRMIELTRTVAARLSQRLGN